MFRSGAASLALLLTSRLAPSACQCAAAAATEPSGASDSPGVVQQAALATMGETGIMYAAVLVYAAALLPQLQLLEITHMPLGVASLVKCALARYSSEADQFGLPTVQKV